MDKNGDLHAIKALTISTDEVISLGLGEKDEILATGPVPNNSIHCAVVVSCLVHFEYVVHCLLVPECCVVRPNYVAQRRNYSTKSNLSILSVF